MGDNDHIDILIGKASSGNASPEELAELRRLTTNSNQHSEAFEQSRNIWQNSNAWLSASDMEKDKLKTQRKLTSNLFLQIEKKKRMLSIYKIAAILAFPLALALGILFTDGMREDDSILSLSEVTAPIGHVAKCKLPDGTVVWLNSGSTMSYSTNDFSSGKREISLDGEAYFNVHKDRQSIFYVRTLYADIKVTGTSFNVKAYADSEMFETVLSEGSVELDLKRKGQEFVKLKPGEKGLYEKKQGELQIQKVDTELYSSWRNGEIIFKDATLHELVTELERIYDIRFQYKDPAMANYRFRGMFSYNKNLIDALEKIKMTARIDYYIENKEVWLTRRNLKK